MVALVRSADQRLTCSGVLLTPRVVLTAAHCQIDERSHWGYHAVIGPTQTGGQVVGIVDARIHPEFRPSTFTNDLAILFLAEDAPVPPITTWTSAPPAVDQAVRVVGFGETSAGRGDGGERRQTATRVTEVTASELTLSPDPGQPCGGDSGGAAFATVGGAEVLVGTISNGDDLLLPSRLVDGDASRVVDEHRAAARAVSPG